MDKKKLAQLGETVSLINDLENQMATLSDADLQSKTSQFKQRLTKGESADDLLPEAFTVVREASKRTIGLRHDDTQLMGGILLHQRSIAEIGAGEGKTLVATLPVYLNVLAGNKVHVVALNDYLAQRNASWMGDLYRFLGLSVGVIVTGMENEQRREAYAADVTYGYNQELIFDHLKDYRAFKSSDQVQGKPDFAIVDDADSILIDAASKAVVLTSEPKPGDEKLYLAMDQIVSQLSPHRTDSDHGHYLVDSDNRRIYLTESGRQHVESLLQNSGLLNKEETLYNAKNRILLVHHLNAALLAHQIFKRNTDYVVIDQQVKIIDKQTGKVREDRYVWWFHEALEAKEKVPVRLRNKTIASISVQNYFRLYNGLAGMSGTASSEENEYQTIYGMDVNVVPRRLPTIREDLNDLVYLTEHAKFNAVVRDIEHCISEGDPVLVNCTTPEKSAHLDQLLKQKNIQHVVLDEKQQPDLVEKSMMAAGAPSAVTILTNMTGWWADIPRTDESAATGGLYVIGTERHDDRRLDDQLASISGRRGSTGWCRFYLSLEDRLIRLFNSERTSSLMRQMGQKEDEAAESKLLTKVIENSQHKVQEYNFKKRMNFLEYDDVINAQRKVVYQQHDELVSVDGVSNKIKQLREEAINRIVDRFVSSQNRSEQWDILGLETALLDEFDVNVDIKNWLVANSSLTKDTLKQHIIDVWDDNYHQKESKHGADELRQIEKTVMLTAYEEQWQDYLVAVEILRLDNRLLDSIAPTSPAKAADNTIWKMIPGKRAKSHVRDIQEQERFLAFAQSAGEYFERLQSSVGHKVISYLSRGKIKFEYESETTEKTEETGSNTQVGLAPQTPDSTGNKVSRNAMCPCGSGKRYKHCHGAL